MVLAWKWRPRTSSNTKNSDIPRLKIVINWASHNDDLNEQSVLIGPKFEHEFQIPAAADTMSLNLSPARLPHFAEKWPLRKDVGPRCRATVGMRIKDKSGYISNLQETEILQIHVRIWVSSYCVKRLEMAGKFHCVTRKNHKFFLTNKSRGLIFFFVCLYC